MTTHESPRPLTLEEAVTAFLELAVLPPEKPPRTQRAQRDNEFLILGYNRAQETLRSILAAHGADDVVRALGEVRADGQRQPMAGPGGMKMWVVE